MKKLSRRLISLFLCIGMLCTFLPTALAATGTKCTIWIQCDKDRYEVNETVTAHIMAKQEGGGDFELHYLQLKIIFDTDYLEPGSCASDISSDVVFNSPLAYDNSYKKAEISYNQLGTPVSCTANANGEVELARLTFTAKTNTPTAGTTMGFVVSDGKAGQIAVGSDNMYYPTLEDVGNGTVHIGAAPAVTKTVTYDLNDGTGTKQTEDRVVGIAFNLAAAPTRDGYEFLGWNDGTKTFDAGAEYTMPDNNVTFTAQWKQTKFMVRYEANGATSGTVPKEESILAGTKINVQTSDLKRDGYDFDGWLCSFDNAVHEAGYTFTMPEKDVTITAQWKEKTTPAPNPGGNGSGSGGVTTYPVTVNAPANGTAAADKKSAASGTTVTITVTPETGYKVGTVTVKDKNGNTVTTTEKDGKYSFKMPASAVSVDVTFVRDGQSSGVGDCPKDSTCPVDPFKDTANDAWWHDGIHYCVQQGLMNGVASDQFAPNGTTTRAMIVTILWRMEGSPATSYGMSFTDVPAGQWYTEAIRWAQSTGVVTGYDAQTFGPNNNVTREQLAAILYRYTAHKGGDVSQRSTLAQFTDVSQISSWALENIQWANAVGMVNGRTATTIVPKGNATRAEAASMIQRFCQNVLKL